MGWGGRRLESCIVAGAALALAAACGFAIRALLAAKGLESGASAAAAITGALVFAIVAELLHGVGPPRVRLPRFALAPMPEPAPQALAEGARDGPRPPAPEAADAAEALRLALLDLRRSLR